MVKDQECDGQWGAGVKGWLAGRGGTMSV